MTATSVDGMRLLTTEDFTEDDTKAWVESGIGCSPENLLDLALWWRRGGFPTTEALTWIDVLGAHGMLWAPLWTAAGYTTPRPSRRPPACRSRHRRSHAPLASRRP